MPFDLVHCDLWTSPVYSVTGFKYFLVIIDDYSQFIWTFPLKHKSDTATTIKHFFKHIQTQFHTTIKLLQCDHGREFDNSELTSFFQLMGSAFRFSCPHSSPQNGKAERMIRTITNAIRTLLFHGRLPAKFWVEALNTATHLINLLPSSTQHMLTPHESLYKTPPTYTHLRTFGFLCYPNLTTTTKHKLEPRSTPCIFLGYATSHKGYRCLALDTHKVIISRNVIFDEFQFPYKLSNSAQDTDLDQFTEEPQISQSLPLIRPDPTNLPINRNSQNSKTKPIPTPRLPRPLSTDLMDPTISPPLHILPIDSSKNKSMDLPSTSRPHPSSPAQTTCVDPTPAPQTPLSAHVHPTHPAPVRGPHHSPIFNALSPHQPANAAYASLFVFNSTGRQAYLLVLDCLVSGLPPLNNQRPQYRILDAGSGSASPFSGHSSNSYLLRYVAQPRTVRPRVTYSVKDG
ncbi:hypothetical protein V2J09_020478 [Rumex salicifolius]